MKKVSALLVGVSPAVSVRGVAFGHPLISCAGTRSCTGSGPLPGLRGAWLGLEACEQVATGRRKGLRSHRFFSEPLPEPWDTVSPAPGGSHPERSPGAEPAEQGWVRGPCSRRPRGGRWLSRKGGRHGPGCRGGRAARASPWPRNTAHPRAGGQGQCHAGPRGRERGSRL